MYPDGTLKPGNFYLFSPPFFFTFVGEYVRHLNFQEIIIANAMYFTRTGATFDILCSEGLVLAGERKSLYHPTRADLELADGSKIRNGNVIPAQGPKWAWRAQTPWVKT